MTPKSRDILQLLVKVLPLRRLIILTEQRSPTPALSRYVFRFICVNSRMVADFALFYEVHTVNWLSVFIQDLVFAGNALFEHVKDFLESDGRQALEERH